MSDATLRPAVVGDIPALLELQSAYYALLPNGGAEVWVSKP